MCHLDRMIGPVILSEARPGEVEGPLYFARITTDWVPHPYAKRTGGFTSVKSLWILLYPSRPHPNPAYYSLTLR